MLPLLFLFAPLRRAERAITVAYFVLILWTSWEFSPKSYGP